MTFSVCGITKKCQWVRVVYSKFVPIASEEGQTDHHHPKSKSNGDKAEKIAQTQIIRKLQFMRRRPNTKLMTMNRDKNDR